MVVTSLEGQMLGKYRVLEALGRGGMARVYRAYHAQLDRYVAIKVLRSELVEEEEFLTRFRREARAVAALRHPNIVHVYDFDVQDDVYYMVMELLEGDTLKVRLNDYRVRDEQMPAGDMLRILLDVLDGLAYAHSEGMIHRDIKPANVLLTRRGQAVITDFGIAQIVGTTQHTASGALMGTLNYMAPEQGLQGHSDVRSDVYSLGIVFYEMLTQRTPFDADTPLAILMKHLHDPLPLPRQIAPSIPEPFEQIVLKALAKEPDDRYQGAQEMAGALREAAEATGIMLPDRLSLPLSFTTAEAPSESVAVLSGTARAKITAAQFAVDDTDPGLAQRLAAEQAAQEAERIPGDVPQQPQSQAPGTGGGESWNELGKEMLSAAGALGRLVLGEAAQALRDAVEAAQKGVSDAHSELQGDFPAASAEETSRAEADRALDRQLDKSVARRAERAARRAADSFSAGVPGPPPVAPSPPHILSGRARSRATKQARPRTLGGVAKAILVAIAVVVVGNLVAVWLAGLTGRWAIFAIGWPVELFLVGLGLCMIMVAAASIWMLVPVGILLGNGILLSYFSLTGNWQHWAFLWPLELFLLVGTIWLTSRLARRGEIAQRLSRALGWMLGLMATAWSIIVALLALAMAVITPA